MPNNQEKRNQNKILDESMQRALTKVQGEMPSVKKINIAPSESNFLTRVFMPRGANAVTNPFSGNIFYNPEQMQDMNPNETENVIAHELTHTDQTQNIPWWQLVKEVFTPGEQVPKEIGPSSPLNNPYYWRPRELEAFQTEKDRILAKRLPWMRDPMTGRVDIPLFPNAQMGPKQIDTAPSNPMIQDYVNKQGKRVR